MALRWPCPGVWWGPEFGRGGSGRMSRRPASARVAAKVGPRAPASGMSCSIRPWLKCASSGKRLATACAFRSFCVAERSATEPAARIGCDDILIFGKSPEEVIVMYAMFSKAVAKCGLRLREEKLALWSNDDGEPVHVGANRTRPQASLVFLGVLFTRDRRNYCGARGVGSPGSGLPLRLLVGGTHHSEIPTSRGRADWKLGSPSEGASEITLDVPYQACVVGHGRRSAPQNCGQCARQWGVSR